MAIALKLATDDTPEPWQAALPTGLAGAAESMSLDYAREGLPSAPRRSAWRTLGRGVVRVAKCFGWLIGSVLVAAAFALLVAAMFVRVAFAAGALLLLGVRRLSPFRIYDWLRFRGKVPYAREA